MHRRTAHWRRWFATAALLALTAAVLAACGGSGSTSGGAAPSKTKANGPVAGTLSFYNFLPDGSEGKWWDDFVASFKKKYPNVKVEVTKFSTEDYWTKTLAAFSSGSEPDIFIPNAGEDLNKYIRAGKIAALENLVDLKYYNPATLVPFKDSKGHIDGIPIYSYIILGWDNQNLLSKYRLAVPKTWDELLAACHKLSDAGVIPIAMGNAGQDQFPTGQLQDHLLYQLGGPKLTLNATYGTNGAKWTDPVFVNAAKQMRALIDAKCFPRGFTGLNYSQMSNLFAQGKAAMAFTGSWFANQVGSSGAKFKAGVFPFPDAPGTTHSTASLDGILGGVNGLAASAKAAQRNPAAVKAFLDAFGAAADEYANTNSQLSAAAHPHPTGSGLQAELSQVFQSVKEIAPVSDTILPRAMAGKYNGDVVALTAGDMTPESWAKAMADAAAQEKPNLPNLG
ncbi:MAG TPA: extracellular solute-binding protein [Conexibacter sp.]|jgi:raffinose/stachyose/melibiose transport system substrate-binding protein|nr:extracellular solute-binding protein [Conexibacter sp.]